jgi:hypothetical protein
VRWGRLTVNPVDAADPPKASAEHSDRLSVNGVGQMSELKTRFGAQERSAGPLPLAPHSRLREE